MDDVESVDKVGVDPPEFISELSVFPEVVCDIVRDVEELGKMVGTEVPEIVSELSTSVSAVEAVGEDDTISAVLERSLEVEGL